MQGGERHCVTDCGIIGFCMTRNVIITLMYYNFRKLAQKRRDERDERDEKDVKDVKDVKDGKDGKERLSFKPFKSFPSL